MAAAAIPYVAMGLSALGGLFGNRQQKQTQTSRSTSQLTNNFTGGSTNGYYGENRYKYDPALWGYRNQLIGSGQDLLQKKLQDPTNYVRSLVNQNVMNVNNQAGAQRAALGNSLRARGLSASPMAAAAQSMNEANRISQITQLLNQTPQLQRQAELENAQQENAYKQLAAQIFGTIPKDQETEGFQNTSNWGSSEQKGENGSFTEGTIPGNMMGGMFNDLSSMLAFLYGQGAFGGSGNSKAGNGWSMVNPGSLMIGGGGPF